jgi:hypothetical protein
MLQRKLDFSSLSKPSKSNPGNWSVTKSLGYRSDQGKSTRKGVTSSVSYRLTFNNNNLTKLVDDLYKIFLRSHHSLN